MSLEAFMRLGRAATFGTVVLAALFAGCTPSQDMTQRSTPVTAPAPPVTALDVAGGPLVSTVWRITNPASRPLGSFYIFLPNGTLVMTSCVETYRLATWQAEMTDRLTIVEDPTVRYTADILMLSQNSLSLRLNLRSEQVDLTFEPAQAPFVCPDLPR
jgi:hypothetical protein